MANINVDGAALISAGEGLKNYANVEIINKINKIKNDKAQVNWQGTGAEAAMASFDKFLTEMEKLSKGIASYGQFLIAAGNLYREGDIRTAQVFSNNFYG